MRWRFILNVVSILLIFLGATMLIPLLIGIVYMDQSIMAFLRSMEITLVSGFIFYFISKNEDEKTDHISSREGMAVVAIGLNRNVAG